MPQVVQRDANVPLRLGRRRVQRPDGPRPRRRERRLRDDWSRGRCHNDFPRSRLQGVIRRDSAGDHPVPAARSFQRPRRDERALFCPQPLRRFCRRPVAATLVRAVRSKAGGGDRPDGRWRTSVRSTTRDDDGVVTPRDWRNPLSFSNPRAIRFDAALSSIRNEAAVSCTLSPLKNRSSTASRSLLLNRSIPDSSSGLISFHCESGSTATSGRAEACSYFSRRCCLRMTSLETLRVA